MTPPAYTEEALLHFAQVVRTYTGVVIGQTSAEAVLERIFEDYASDKQRERREFMARPGPV